MGPPMRETSSGTALKPPRALICRCEELTDEEIAASIAAGARTVDDVKRRTRAGMGACQGIFCMPVIAALVAQGTGTEISMVAPMTGRPPVRPIPIQAMADLVEDLATMNSANDEGQA
jgi:NAD(P)H-nitrite reductase large subunit